MGWLAFAPTALGGSSTYVTTYGTSMEPTLHRGDLAIVRERPAYRVGDVVAYRSASLHTIVLHRIIGRTGDRFTFKGDNNTWTDTDHPTVGELVGRMDTSVPGLGSHVQQASSPSGIAVLASVVALPVGIKRRRRPSRADDEDCVADHSDANDSNGDGDASTTEAPPGHWPIRAQIDPKMLVATAVVAAVVALAFTRSPITQTTNDVPFDDRGEFSYSGAAPGGTAVYQSERVSSGQPIFLNLVQQVAIDFTYRASSAQPVEATGAVTLTGMLQDANGWTYPFDLGAPTPLQEGGATIGGTLDLQALRATIAAKESATGVARDMYTVVVHASVDRKVRHAATATHGVFEAALAFELTDLEMHLSSPGGDTLTPSQGGLLSLPVQRLNHLVILGQSLSIAALRAVALGLLLLLAAVWVDWLIRARRGDEQSLIERRYRSYLLPVHAGPVWSGPVVDVVSIAALARLADHADAPMLRGDDGTYQVIDGSRVYRYTSTHHGARS